MPSNVIVGGFFGDEGKGKVIAYLALKDKPDIAVRGGVGPNAGHTFVINGNVHKVRMVPSALANPTTRLMIGAGVLVNPQVFLDEINRYNLKDRIYIDRHAGIITSKHIERDSANDLKGRIGTTGSGSGPANADRALRILPLAKDVKELSIYLDDVSSKINDLLDNDGKLLVEGTQGTFLSLYHGTYPYVTSKDVTASAICSDIGLGPKRVDEVTIVFKAYVTRVGEGELEGELSREEAEKRGWLEIATVTGRVRRAAPFNFKLAEKAIRLNSATQIALTKLDIVFPECSKIKDYDKLSDRAKEFIEEIEDRLGLRVTLIGTGEDVYDMIDRRDIG
ncbi:MAG: adenylosuccinate synthetase [Candidatus Nitrosocaldaceae archaeon]|nr:MAG: adenylosuccinate synthetase [Candidatus Nitrosocaldaceae archaeon]